MLVSHMVHDDAHTTHCETSPTPPRNRQKSIATPIGSPLSFSYPSVASTSRSDEQRVRRQANARDYGGCNWDEDAEYAPSYQDAMRTVTYAAPTATATAAVDMLPSYTPSIQLLSLCRRKQLFTSKNQRAKRRSWTVVWLLLDGTALRVYTPTRDEEKRFVKEWKEKYCTSSSKNVRAVGKENTKKEGEGEGEELEDVDAYEERTRRQNNGTNRRNEPIPTTMTLATTTRGRSGSTVKHPLSASTTRPSTPQSILTTVSTTTSTSTSTSATSTATTKSNIPRILARQPHKSYSTRNATCTRPNAYFKRAFVVEITLEDQTKFLVQLNDYEETQGWMNAMAVAAPLALDLDERVMVEPSPFPRYHRHARPNSLSLSLSTSTQLSRAVSDDDEERRRRMQTPTSTDVPIRPQRRRPSTAPAAL
ncbi:hypothetical protein FRC14_003770 [Serendipita sp. 396]|nr:hypothetical protein FRC14_003770 [Serendipita sp. 396]KAG8777112.1 hypothetical protein FRC16_004285 [Serendipita sp. 398]KAG8782966.1 hypothetical protein FRC15_005974 [Serendipita sp. 397]KAG8845824.1 hypothetical protein FRB91_001457 [Serendipita sp. 411]KAG8867183.1 hypothetical protein FRC20_006502 [Serendipita sp. 405]